MSRFRLSDQVKALQQKHEQLRLEVAALVRAKRGLLLRHALLSAWCDSLSFLQLRLAASADIGTGQFELLLQKEVDLLQQLTGSEDVPVSQRLEALVQPEVDTIAPCTDPMAYLHHIVSQPIAQEASTMTVEQLGAVMQKSVLSISIMLHQLEGVTPWERPGMLTRIAEAWNRYMHIAGSMIMIGKQDVLERAHALNLETLQPDPAAAASHQAAQAAVLVPMLGLTEQQQEIITAGMHLYYDLEHSIHQERQQLQAQMAAVEEDARSTDIWPDRTSSSGSANGALDGWSARGLQLQKQEALTSRLELLLHKEYMLRMAAMGWFVGSLSYEQLSRLAVMSWPYFMRLLFLATEIMQQREKLTQQRLQLCI